MEARLEGGLDDSGGRDVLLHDAGQKQEDDESEGDQSTGSRDQPEVISE